MNVSGGKRQEREKKQMNSVNMVNESLNAYGIIQCTHKNG